jgi:hypothetical protein
VKSTALEKQLTEAGVRFSAVRKSKKNMHAGTELPFYWLPRESLSHRAVSRGARSPSLLPPPCSMFVTTEVRFRSEEDLAAALDAMKGLTNKFGRPLSVARSVDAKRGRDWDDPDGGTGARQKRRGNAPLENPDDWPCLACGTMNFAKRTQCYNRSCKTDRGATTSAAMASAGPVTAGAALAAGAGSGAVSGHGAVGPGDGTERDGDGAGDGSAVGDTDGIAATAVDGDGDEDAARDDHALLAGQGGLADDDDDVGMEVLPGADIRDAVTPWYAVPMEDQLKRKAKSVEHALRRMRRKLRATLLKQGVKLGKSKGEAFKDIPAWWVSCWGLRHRSCPGAFLYVLAMCCLVYLQVFMRCAAVLPALPPVQACGRQRHVRHVLPL